MAYTDPTCPACNRNRLYEDETLCPPCLAKADATECQRTHPNWCIDGPHLCPPGCTDCPYTSFNQPPSALPAGWTPPAELVTTIRRLAGSGSNVGDPDATLTALQRARRTSGSGIGVADGAWWPRHMDGEEAPEE